MGTWDLRWSLPALVLAIPEPDVQFDFKPGREWQYIDHQTAGVACHHPRMFASRLTIRPEYEAALYKIDKHWYASNVGAWRSMLDDILRYRSLLQEWLGADCNLTYRFFEEGIYPIDCDAQTIRRLTLDEVPDDLNELITWKSPWQTIMGIIGRWVLFILAENSD